MAIFFTPSSAIRDRFRMFQWTFLDWQDRFCCWSSRSSLNSVVYVIIWRQGMLKWKHETFVPEPNCLGGGGGDEKVTKVLVYSLERKRWKIQLEYFSIIWVLPRASMICFWRTRILLNIVTCQQGCARIVGQEKEEKALVPYSPCKMDIFSFREGMSLCGTSSAKKKWRQHTRVIHSWMCSNAITVVQSFYYSCRSSPGWIKCQSSQEFWCHTWLR